MSDFKTKLEAARDRFADLQAEYYSNVQFPPTWIDVKSVDGLKQDVNAARRKACYDHHKWGVQKGFDAAAAHLLRCLSYIEQSQLDVREVYMNASHGRIIKAEELHREAIKKARVVLAEIKKELGEVE